MTQPRIDVIGQNGNDGLAYTDLPPVELTKTAKAVRAELPTDYQKFIHLSRYARWDDTKGRRETWEETIDRLITFWRGKFTKKQVPDNVLEELRTAILNLEVMPSMRTLMTAGPALDRDNVAAFNCSYVAVDHQRVFDEILYVLMCGTGVGFSVEREYTRKLPEVAEEFYDTDTTITVADSKIGWAKSYRELVSLLYNGQIPKWDVSRVRPAGARLKTFGGRASGPGPLVDLFNFTVEIFKNAKGRRLTPLECHDIVCKIADVVVVGGVRRSALISLSNLTDERLRTAKSGAWYDDNPQRGLANNSVAYTEKPDMGIFMREWQSLFESKSGERGIFNREAAERLVPERRKESDYKDYGCNPCSEIVLRNKQFCNLTEVVARPDDTEETLQKKIRRATILGTLQASLTNFRYLSSKWQVNTEEEALLGVSITGIMDCPALFADDSILEPMLNRLREKTIEVNKDWSKRIGINHAAAITCIKPSGTVSQLVDSASGIHPRYSPYYIRTVRADKKDPLAKMMVDMGFPVEDDVMKPDTGYVFSFPMKAPEHAVFRDQIAAIEQLKLWETYQLHYTEHKPSITVYYKENEFLEVGAWCYENFDILSGVSFLPHSDHIYPQAPYQEIDKKTYEEMNSKMPKDVDWNKLGEYETEDSTESYKELACSAGGGCEL